MYRISHSVPRTLAEVNALRKILLRDLAKLQNQTVKPEPHGGHILVLDTDGKIEYKFKNDL